MFCTSGTGKSSGSKPPRKSQDGSSKAQVPLLLHFDVNKTVIQSDSVQMKGVEEGIREGIADLFWGNLQKSGGSESWEWIKAEPSCAPPKDDILAVGTTPLNYTQWCKRFVQDKKAMKEAVRSFSLVQGQPVEKEMKKLLQLTMKKMQLRPEVRKSKEAEAAGLLGPTFNMFPALFQMVVQLQRQRRPFAILFRSFGADHEKIQREWNAFCEMRHPIFSRLIEDIGPMDGSTPGVPDRRIHSIHTLYRDASGPMVLLDTFTNGPEDSPWDSWVRTKPKPTADTRNGKSWTKQVLKSKVVEGFTAFRKFCADHLAKQATAAIKDDWAWWQFHNEQAHGGKLMTLLRRKDNAQVFFDDNIEPFDARIVDCRDDYGNTVPDSVALDKYLVKVNPVEAMLDDNYFLRKLLATQGDHIDVGSSLIGVQKQLADKEEENGTLVKQLQNLGQHLKQLMEENRRMKQQRRIPVRDENELKRILHKDGIDTNKFGTGNFKSLRNLQTEIDQGASWLQDNDHGRIVRVLDMVYLMIKYNDMLLVESHEQDGSNGNIIRTRNYLPGVRMRVEDNMQDVIDRWFQTGLQVDISPYIETQEMPVYVPDAPPQQSLLTEAYPLACMIQASQGTFVIPDKEVELYKDLFAKIGLPGGKSFSTVSKDAVDEQSVITRLWRWDKIKNWKEHAASGGKSSMQVQDVSETCRRLFKDHPRAEIYQRLLLQMFEVFEAQKLTGGFSGSLVIRVQPFEADGRPGEPCIVKLDEGKAIRTEASNSENVFKALPDRAARILGDAVYGRDKENQEFGAMRLELAGACWNIPELAQGSSSLLSTFKDLLLYESEQMLLSSTALLGSDDMRPFGNVNSVLAETFGPGGIVSSLRKGGSGLHRNIDKPLISGWYTLKGKESKYNIFVAKKGEYPPDQAMRRMYKEYFGSEPPDLKVLVNGNIRPKLEELAKMETGHNLCPLVGLAHGDLNAANVMIDALDAVWLIDFATSIELPLFTDMCKFEMACLFEYATIPITPKMLVEFASTQEAAWSELNVGDWLHVDQKTAEFLLQRLVALPQDRLAGLSANELEKLLDEVVTKCGRTQNKQKALHRALSARLVAEQSYTDAAFNYCYSISNALLTGDYIKDSLEIRGVPLPEGRGARGATSLRFFMEICASIRRFMLADVMGVLREHSKKNPPAVVDTLSLQLWLPFLRESYRIVGYRDIAPQYKVWCIYHCYMVARKVLSILEVIQKNIRNPSKLHMMSSIKDDLGSRGIEKAPTRRSDRYSTAGERAMQLTSHWVRSYSHFFRTYSTAQKAVRKVHKACTRYKDEPGFFAPVFQAQTVNGDNLCRLSFYDLNERQESAEKAWELWLLDAKSLGNNGYTQNVKLGWVLGSKTEPEVILSSRLVPLTDVFLRRKLEDLKEANSQEMREILGTYVLHKWMDMGDEDVRPQQAKGRGGTVGRVEDVDGFLCLPLVVKDRAGHDVLQLEIIVGAPCYCYPPGSMLCVDPTAEVPNWAQKSPCVVVQHVTEAASGYMVRGAVALTSGEGDGLAEFEPLPGNHTYLVPLKYQVAKFILFKQPAREPGHEAPWTEGVIQQLPSQDNRFCHIVKFVSGAAMDREEPLHLDGMNSGIRVANMTASAYDEEVSKIKGHFRARHSWIMDSLSGTRFNVKECAPPTLSTVTVNYNVKSEGSNMTSSMSISKLMRRSASAFSNNLGGPGDGTTSEVKTGWQTVLQAVESYNLGQPSCFPNAFLVKGSPGSGKSCFVGRLLMELLDRYENLIPLMLPVAGLVKRSDPEGPDAYDADAVQDWFDNYLRITYGEDSLRYSMICQAISMSRVVFLFEGLEDAEKPTKAVESLIRVLVRAKNLVVVTSRPLLSGRSALENEPELIVTMRLENLSDEQKRMVAYARLGAEGIEAYDKLLSRLRTSQNVSDQGEEAATDGAEDVFGNPMMLSMLLCYLQTTAKTKNAEKRETDVDEKGGEESEETTLTAVYRVAVDVMLQRLQARTQADRIKAQERVDQFKQILQIMAMAMQISRRVEIRVEEVETLLKPELQAGWEALKSAVSAGHAMFLRMTGEVGREELRFLVKGFQNFFAASCVAAEGAEGLPDLKELLTDAWWQQMLEMLGEAWPMNYVEIVQSRLGQFKSTSKDNFLHIAARSGHRPIFQLLHRFAEQHKAALNQRGEDGMLPLHLAAQTGHTQLIELMLKAGSALNAEDAGERLAVHIAMRCGHFQTAAYLNDRWLETYGNVKTYERRSRKAEQLAQRLTGLTEAQFLAGANETFTELGFFSQKEAEDKRKTVGALLAVFWIVANQYDQFVRGQDEKNRLSRSSWEHLQDWTTNTVRLTKSHSMVSAMLVYVAIMNVGKIKPFRAAFAPEEDEATEALARVLHRSPILVPSFAKLELEQQQIILSALKADFNFGQFLQAENLPANLFTVRQILAEGGAAAGGGAAPGDILGFFLFRIFAAMSGILGAKSLEGSIFMHETNYKNFEVGLDTLMHLIEDGAVRVYDRFLEARAKNQGLTFWIDGHREYRALVRLACMMRVFDSTAGQQVAAAWQGLPDARRHKLVNFLNADGVKVTPAFLLYHAPNFLTNAKDNEGQFPLEMVFEVLLQVYEAAAKEYENSDQKVITIMVEELMNYAKTCKDVEVFQHVKFEIARTPGQKGDHMGNLLISPWQIVVDKRKLDSLEQEAGNMFLELSPQTGLKENVYLKHHLQNLFPELGFFRDQDEVTKMLLRETLGRLLVVYWTATDQPEAFTRGQEIEKKLSENSWSKIREMTSASLENAEVFNAVLTAMAVMDVAKLPKFQAQLASECSSPTQVLAHVLDNSPKVLPSFVRMPQEAQALARDCLTSEFIFGEFIWAEIPPASVTAVKTMLSDSRKTLTKKKYLDVFLYSVFVAMSASKGSQSLEGSLYMTEDRWEEFEVGKNAIQRLERESEQVVYDSILARSAKTAGLSFDSSSIESRALARLACMCNTDREQGGLLNEAYQSMEDTQRLALSKYLAADGIDQQPAFAFQNARQFLQKAMANEEVGPLPAMLILLKVCENVQKKFAGSKSVLMVKLTRLAAFAQEFQGSVAFQDMPFALEPAGEGCALVIPKVWIPVRNQDMLKTLTNNCRQMAQNVLAGSMGEKRFKATLPRLFPELGYFGNFHHKQHQQTYGALLSVYWLINDQHDAFTREQEQSDTLSKQSWAWIQEWMSEHVKLNSEEVVDSTMVFMAIHALGKITQFREEAAPGFASDLHDVALAHILEEQPEVVPSFHRLSHKYKSLIIDSLSVDFQFSQFLQAEIVPSSLVVVKEKLQQHGDEGYSLFCFRIFAQMSGKLGHKSLHGSLFMTESQFQRFRPGLEALMQLRNMDAGPAYNAFLLLRGSKALSRFASWQHQALVRLLCLSTAYDHESGDAVCNAFDKLSHAEQQALTRWLIADGISQRPGYVLCDAPELLRNAQANPAVGLTQALKALVRVQEMCQGLDPYYLPSFGAAGPVKAYVHLRELALLAREAGPSSQDFSLAELKVSAEHGENRSYTVQVMQQKGADKFYADESRGRCSCCCRVVRCFLLFLLLILFVGPGAAAAGLYFKPGKVFKLMDKVPEKPYLKQTLDLVQDHPHLSFYVLLAVSLLSFFGLCVTCCCRSSGSQRPLVYESIGERVWCCAARTTSRMAGSRDEARTACCAYQPLTQLETGAGEPLVPRAVGRNA